MVLLALFKDLTFTLVSPKELKMPDYIINLLRERNHRVFEMENLEEGVAKAEVIYLTRIQEERFPSPQEYEKHKGKYTIDQRFYDQFCAKGATLMHPLPRDSRLKAPELNNDLNYLGQLAIFRQSDNGIPIRMALFCIILGIENKVFESLEDVPWHFPGLGIPKHVVL